GSKPDRRSRRSRRGRFDRLRDRAHPPPLHVLPPAYLGVLRPAVARTEGVCLMPPVGLELTSPPTATARGRSRPDGRVIQSRPSGRTPEARWLACPAWMTLRRLRSDAPSRCRCGSGRAFWGGGAGGPTARSPGAFR